MEKLILIGAGGYAKSVIDSIDYFNYELVGFIDQYSDSPNHLGYPILGKEIECLDDPFSFSYFIYLFLFQL